MAPSSVEQKVRKQLSFARFMQAYMPIGLANWLIKKGLPRVQLEPGIEREFISANGVPCVWFVPEGSREDKVLLYLHGGGFVYGLTPPHFEMVAYIAKKMETRVLMVDYRLAPKHPFPAALEDCVAAYHWLHKQGYSAGDIVVAGDSAGGNLTLTTLMKLRDDGISLPAAAACLSPVGDLTERTNGPKMRDPLLHPKAMKFFRRAYIGKSSAKEPLISPVWGSLEGLPPMLIHAGEDEVLRDDAVRLAEQAERAGVDVQLAIYPRMWHVWQLYLSIPEATQSLDTIATFLVSKL